MHDRRGSERDFNAIGPWPNRDEAVIDQLEARCVERAGDLSAQRAEAGRTADGDTLEISEDARELARARQAVDDAPDIRAEKVAEIKQRISDGSYSVSAESLAEKLLEGADGGV